MNFEHFSTVEFPPINRDIPGFVYVWFLTKGAAEAPFYAGQTKRLWGRLDDYYWASFSATADFRAGEAVRYLSEKGFDYRTTDELRSAPECKSSRES
jgi:hypothetical protein